jgi:hypothetical protein
MASVEIRDETVVVVDRGAFAAVVADAGRWGAWWPGCHVVVVVDRGMDGLRWSITGALVGYTEVRLVAHETGALVRYELVADPTVPGTVDRPRAIPDSPRGRRELDDVRRRQLMAWKRTVWSIMEALEAGAGFPDRAD